MSERDWAPVLRRVANILADRADEETLARLGYVRRDTASREIVADPETDCATGFCTCGACGEPIDPWDLYCRWCGARMEDI